MARNSPIIDIKVTADVDAASKGFDKLGKDAKDAGEKVKKGIGDEAGKGFEKLRDGADDSERRIIGFRDALTGTSDIAAGFREGNLVLLATGFADMASSVANLGADLLEWGKKALEAGKNAVKAHAGSMAATLKDTAATVAHKTASLASAAASKAYAAAQWLVNAAMNANPILLIVTALAALAAAFYVAYQRSETFRNIVQSILGFVTDLAKVVGGALVDAVDAVVGFFKDLPGNILSFLEDAPKWLYDTGVKILTGLLDGIKWYAELLWKFYVELPLKILEKIGDVTRSLWNKGTDLLGGLLGGIAEKAVDLFTWFYVELPLKILEKIGKAELWLLDKGRDILKGLWLGVLNFAQTLWDWFEAIPSRLYELFKDAALWLVDAGKRIVKGLYDGIVNAPYDIMAAIAEKVPGSGFVKYGTRSGNVLQNQIPTMESQQGIDLNGNGIIGRWVGGSVIPGQTYMVGERGPELLTVGSRGHVTPNHALGGNITIIINGFVGSEAEIGRQANRQLERYNRRNGR